MTIRPVQTTPMTFDGKSEKFELFEDLFHTMIKMQPAMKEQMKINHFHSLLRKGALQTFRNINSINRQTLEDVLVIFRRKYVKPESQATAKHKWHRLTFDPNTMRLPDFLEELNQGAEKAFGENAKSMIDSLLYANCLQNSNDLSTWPAWRTVHTKKLSLILKESLNSMHWKSLMTYQWPPWPLRLPATTICCRMA